MTRVAFLGLGAIGAPMAKHLAQPPFELAVWNRTAAKARTFAFSAGTGVRGAKSAAGSGDAVKAVNNALLAIHVWAAGEGLAALTKAGVSPALALDVINSSSGSSRTTERLFPERVLTRAYPRTFRLALLDKDVGIAAG